MLVLARMMVLCQPNTTINLDKDKPKQYENRQLRSEKTGDSKLKGSAKWYQNMVTHYNYFFNANNKLNEVVDKAKMQFKDDYTQLLPFYNYTLDATENEQLLDSVIYKCNAGILLHDLRNNWVDDLYLLLGKAYFFKKNFDSAQQVFQYINYIYAPKDDGYDIPIGSNASNNNGLFTVATNEKKTILKKITHIPTRNESFLWQVRNYLEQNKLVEANGLLAILKIDPNFPERLQSQLNELIGYNFYKQKVYDSAAVYLQKSLKNAATNSELARWQFLCGQLYQLASLPDAAIAMFKKSIQFTIDPYLNVYARLNIVHLASQKNKTNAVQENLTSLYKLAKKDKFEDYRDIIYYAAALLEFQQKSISNSINDLIKSIELSTNNTAQKQKSFLQLADFYYQTKNYQQALNAYDSVTTSSLSTTEKNKITLLKPVLKKIVENNATIHLQDSLLHLASLSDEERLIAVKKIYHQLRKKQGLKDVAENNLYPMPDNATLTNNNLNNFYFLNASIKTQGFKDFKLRWGDRPNVDNWQRQSAITKRINNNAAVNVLDVDVAQNTITKTTATITIEGLLENIPLTTKRMKDSNDSIANALFNNAEIFENSLEEYVSAIENYTALLKRYPNYPNSEKSIFNLAYCYFKINALSQFDSLKNVLNKNYPNGLWTNKINKREYENANDSTIIIGAIKEEAITKKYDAIYNLFVEGKFTEAEDEKQKQDKLFGSKFWTPQLLFIEAIYYIQQKKDSIAILKLQHIVNNYSKSPMAEKAQTMINTVKKRKEIENYLTNLTIDSASNIITRHVDIDTASAITITKPTIHSDSLINTTATNKPIAIAVIKPKINQPIISENNFVFTPTDQHYVMIVLNKVDEVFINETKNAFTRFNKERYYNQKIDITSFKISDTYTIVLMGLFNNSADAVTYYDNVKPSIATRIVPWLNKDKYALYIINSVNLEKIKTNKNIEDYTKFIKDIFPDKF